MGERARELAILIFGDIIIFNVSVFVTLLLRYWQWPSSELLSLHIAIFFWFSLIWLVVFFILGLYDKHTGLLKQSLLNRLVYAQIINGIIAVILFFTLPLGIEPKTNLFLYFVISSVYLVLWRWWAAPRVSAPAHRYKAVLLAEGPEAIELVDEINNNDRYNYYFIRIIDATAIKEADNFAEKLTSLIKKESVDLIVADSRSDEIKKVLPMLFDLAFMRFACTFLEFNRLYTDTFDRVPVGMLGYNWFIGNVSQSRKTVYDMVKRGMDIVIAVVLLVPSAALFPFVALAIKIEDRGPLFYTTVRVGQYNRPISIYKVRTKNGRDTGEEALHSELKDTKVGLFLRKTRIDELPQLINVLRGDLSFIGPRPEMPALVDVYAKEVPFYNTRHFLKPGLSGWAQINNYDVPRGGVDVERTTAKLSYDLYYLERRSLMLDLQIWLKTIATVLMRTGT